MAKDTEELTVMLGGAVYVADVGEPRPTDPEIIAGTWEDLGHITTDGIVFEVEREVTDINSVWEQDPIRRLVTRVPKVMRFQLQQLSVHTLPFALGGGTVDEISRLAELRDRGVLSEEEFQRAKAKALG